jgi:UDP-glucuronate 4-epimerase
MTILVTGAAGFVGFHLTQRLLADGEVVYGIDNLNNYYDVQLKEARLSQLQEYPRFQFQRLDMADGAALMHLFETQRFTSVVNLAAQAGVRYSLENPSAYISSNLVGFANLLEACRHFPVAHLVYASSSSVYGANTKIPFAIEDPVDRPVSLYAATKKSNELMAYTYSHLYGTPVTGLRFFTVYGPWGRPDMAYFKFVKLILAQQPIDVFNFGHMERDFTYIDDIIEGVVRVLRHPPVPKTVQKNTEDTSAPPYRLYNIGNHSPVKLLTFIETLEKFLEKTAVKNFIPMQPGEVLATYADIDTLVQDFGFQPTTTLEQGLEKFVQWYRAYYQV